MFSALTGLTEFIFSVQKCPFLIQLIYHVYRVKNKVFPKKRGHLALGSCQTTSVISLSSQKQMV